MFQLFEESLVVLGSEQRCRFCRTTNLLLVVKKSRTVKHG